ncbi:hypothetical protein JCM14469_29240 [Desulfatiferula olefinivorans]
MANDVNPQIKRNYFRAPISAKTRAVLVDESQRGMIRKCLDLKVMPDVDGLMDRPGSQSLAQLVLLLSRIDEKLDRVLEKLGDETTEKRELVVRDTVDISGSGISLLLKEPLAKGRLLHLSITFTGSHMGRLDVLGRVARSVSVGNENDALFQTGIEFEDLTEAEKDQLVKYTFSLNREHIRAAGANNQ